MSEFRPTEQITKNEGHGVWRKALAVGVAATLLLQTTPAKAEQNGPGLCFADECNGLNPVEWGCSKDAGTVASVEVIRDGSYEGQLDLRYSPSCQANWGRFTPASGGRVALRLLSKAPRPHYGRVTVWNPGKTSKGPVEFPGAAHSIYTYMVDGTKVACTGVEVWEGVRDATGEVSMEENLGWSWGPCV